MGPAVGIRTGYFFFPTIALGADLKYARTSGEGQGKSSKDTEITLNLDLELIEIKTDKDTSTTTYPLEDGTVTNALLSLGFTL